LIFPEKLVLIRFICNSCQARLEEWENRLKLNYLIEDLETKKRLTKAYTVQVAIDMATGEMQYVSPEILYQRLGIAL